MEGMDAKIKKVIECVAARIELAEAERHGGDHPHTPIIQGIMADYFTGENELINILENCSEEGVYWLSEVFEEISKNLQSQIFFYYLKTLPRKFPDLNLPYEIAFAE